MEDLWDESVFEDPSKATRSTPVIKISFGAQGEGTVLKIGPKLRKIEDKQAESNPSDEKCDSRNNSVDERRISDNEDQDSRENDEPVIN